jgi:hypothetical protein
VVIEESHERLSRAFLVGIPRCNVVKSDARQLAEEREISLKMGVETVETLKARIDEREGDQRGRGLGEKKHGKLVDEIAVGELLPDSSRIALGREIFLIDLQLLGEVADLLLLGFKEGVIELSENEIERGKAAADVFERVFAAEADVILADGFVKIAGEKVIDLTIAQAGTCLSVALLKEFSNESQAAFSGLAVDEADKLLAGEVAGMRGHEAEKTSFVFGVTEPAQSDAVHARDVHRAKILAVSSCSLSARRKRGISWCRANI